MHFIYVLQLREPYTNPNAWTEETNKVLEMHWNYLVELHKQGVMDAVGRTGYEPGHPDLFGIAVFRAANETEAKNIMNNDPCVKYEVMQAQLHPFNLALIAGGGKPS
jgi:uncharacterized protein YciI